MTLQELDKVIEQLRKSGASDEQIINSFTNLYVNDQINYDELNGMVNYMGYHLDAKLDDMPDKKRKAY